MKENIGGISPEHDGFAGTRHPPESTALGFLGSPDTGMVGYVDEVNGPGALEVNGFRPTKDELTELVKYWYEQVLDYEYGLVFLFAQYCSRGLRLSTFGYVRINRIAQLIGDELVKETIESAELDFGSRQDPALWAMFLNGEKPERDEHGLPVIPASS